ncbi:nitroreductase/quinone reductase family protein [Streptomyces sp. NPDC056568]|uniref:nitroreductase/quinone reductase family protein n=1 Tax=Streptomyces sp. NPDC056568 TaxID=3345866 RepID=UPI00369C1849
MPTPFPRPVTAEDGNPLLLTTTDAGTGAPRTTRLGHARHGGSLVVLASGPGPDRPAWYHDVLARPVVGVEIGTDSFEALAVPTAAPLPPGVVLERAEPEGWQGSAEVRTLADKLLEVHTWLREQVRQVRAETEAHFARRGAGAPAGLGLQIRQRCLAFCQALEFHHVSEDGHLFPGIARHHPGLADVFDRLAGEHRAIARVQADLAALLADLHIADPRRFRTELAAMSAELNAHLDHEEEALIPLLADVPWPPAGPPAAG